MEKVFDRTALKKALEALLFIAREPIALNALAGIVEQKEDEVQGCLEELVSDYEDRGIQVVNLAGGYQIATRPEVSAYVERFLKPAVEVHLTTPALETLAIIAYRQPVSRCQIEKIRGVDCDSVVKTLMDKKLVREAGRADLPGRPILYGTTEDFLFQFGLGSLKDLPAVNLKEQEQKLSDFSFIYEKAKNVPARPEILSEVPMTAIASEVASFNPDGLAAAESSAGQVLN
jgi:segregation and condensation protein B